MLVWWDSDGIPGFWDCMIMFTPQNHLLILGSNKWVLSEEGKKLMKTEKKFSVFPNRAHWEISRKEMGRWGIFSSLLCHSGVTQNHAILPLRILQRFSHNLQDKTQTLELSTKEHSGSRLSSSCCCSPLCMYHLGALPYPVVWSWTQYFFTLTSMSLYIFSPFLKIPLCPSPQSGFAQAIQPQPSAHHLPCLVTSSRLPSLHPTLLRRGALFIASPASSADCPHSAHYAKLKPPLPWLPFPL